MRKSIFILLLLINFSCKSQHKTETMDTEKDKKEIEKRASVLKIKDSIMMKKDKLDIAALMEKGVSSTSSTPTDDGWESSISYEYEENLPNGMYVLISGNEISGYSKTTRAKNNQFEVYSEYYPSGETKQIGELYGNEFTKGTWLWFSDSGVIEKYEDYDAPYKFAWEDVKLFLKEKNVLKEEIHYIGRGEIEGLHQWEVSFRTKELAGTDKVEQYFLNGETGEVIKKGLLDISRELD